MVHASPMQSMPESRARTNHLGPGARRKNPGPFVVATTDAPASKLVFACATFWSPGSGDLPPGRLGNLDKYLQALAGARLVRPSY